MENGAVNERKLRVVLMLQRENVFFIHQFECFRNAYFFRVFQVYFLRGLHCFLGKYVSFVSGEDRMLIVGLGWSFGAAKEGNSKVKGGLGESRGEGCLICCEL